MHRVVVEVIEERLHGLQRECLEHVGADVQVKDAGGGFEHLAAQS